MRNRTLEAVESQTLAMAVEVFEVGLFKPAQPGTSPNEPEMIPRVWDREALLKSVPWLRHQNASGRNIYIRPRGEHHLSLIDDLTADAIKRMQSEGFSPALIVETSPNNFQAWLNHGKVLDKQTSTAAARALAQRFGGDRGAADWRHFGRLAGFTNRKPKHLKQDGTFPFVRIHEQQIHYPYALAERFLASLEIARQVATERRPAAKPQIRPDRLLSIDDFRANPAYGGDGHRIDLAFAVYALSHGLTEEAIAAAIRSRDLSKKGSEIRQAAYVTRTLKKASGHTERLVR